MPDQELRFERRLTHAPEKVWRAITEPQQLSQWYPLAVTELDLSLGGKVAFDDGEGTTYRGEITELEHPRRFAFTEGDDLVRFELRPHDDGCLLVFTHRISEANVWPGATEGWRRCLDDLVTLVTASPDVAPFATLAAAPDGGQVLRFERRLAHAPEKVWRALTEREELHRWFAAHVDRDLTAGAHVTFTMTPEAKRQMNVADGEEALGEGEVTVADPPRLLEYLWTGQLMRWQLTPDGADGCLLVFTTVFDHEGAVDETVGWHAALEVLAAVLDGRDVSWSPWDRVEPLTGVYRRALTA